MSSFKLDTATILKQQVLQGGVLLIILGIMVVLLYSAGLGLAMTLLGLLLALGGKFAS